MNNSINRYLGVMCYPITSIDLLNNNLFERFYSCTSRKEKTDLKKQIVIQVVKYIQSRYGIYSYDEIKMLLEKFFFYEKDYKSIYTCIYDILKQLSASLISQRDGKLVFKYWENDKNILGGFAPQNKLIVFHCMNRHFPMDILAIIYMLENGTSEVRELHRFYGQITVADLQLDQQLELGVAENHLYSGASMPFLSMWNLLMKQLTKRKEEAFTKLVWRDTLYIDGNKIWYFVLSAAILRVYIAMRIREEELNLSDEIKDFVQLFLDNKIDSVFEQDMNQLELSEIFAKFISLWDEITSSVSYDDEMIRILFQVNSDIKTTEENIFLFRTLQYLKKNTDEIREQFQNRNLKKIEFRMGIAPREKDFRKTVNLLKREDINPQEKCYVDGFINDEKIQFGCLQSQYLEQIESMQRLRNESSEMSKYIVGLDAASIENATPVWVFSKVFEQARDSMKDPLMAGNGLEYYQSLNFTFHAGEDFRHILSGIRRIDEAVTHLKFHTGDRIGHGIALGLDVNNWYHENPVVILPRIELLENYLWAYDTLSKAEEDINSVIMAYIEKQIYYLAKKIYCSTKGIKTEVLVDAYLHMFRKGGNFDCTQEKVHKIFCKCIMSDDEVVWNIETLCIARNCNFYVKRMNELVHLKVSAQELEIAKKLQQIIRKKLSRLGIVIEINPTSNVAISNMDSLYENQIYSINNFMQVEDNVLVCINSDDPSVFNTNVSNELAYIFDALLDQGISKENAIAWIEKLRQNGIKSSFIRRSESGQQILEGLIKLVDEL